MEKKVHRFEKKVHHFEKKVRLVEIALAVFHTATSAQSLAPLPCVRHLPVHRGEWRGAISHSATGFATDDIVMIET